MMDKTKRDMTLDLAKHLDKRIEHALHDFMDRCATVDIDYDHATAVALTVLCHYFICAAHGIDATESECIEACRHQFNMRQATSK